MKPIPPAGAQARLPLPADVPPVDLRVQFLLHRMMEELDRPAVQYLITARYYLRPDGRRRYPAHVWFHRETAWNLEPEEDGLACDLILQAGSDRLTRVLIPYAGIFRIARMTRRDGSGFTDDDTLYYNRAVKRQMVADMSRPAADDSIVHPCG